ncbi:hypothetical protein B0H12DRAFT_1149379 [Mycena haematopus]|nr:hypothetical protein B0H12DRAFT_1149379 [Mycena haematopus]
MHSDQLKLFPACRCSHHYLSSTGFTDTNAISRRLRSCARTRKSRHLCGSMWDDAAAMGRATLMERTTAMGRRNGCGTAQRLWRWDGGLGSRST